MEKNEIIALIIAVVSVVLVIFVIAKMRGSEEDETSNIILEPGVVIQTGAPQETDIWDILHDMNATTAPPAENTEPAFVAVTATDENGEVYNVTDADGNNVTELASAPADADGNTTETVTAPVNPDAPVINVNPDMEIPNPDDVESPYFIAVPADD